MKITAFFLLLSTEFLVTCSARIPWSLPRGGTATMTMRPSKVLPGSLRAWGVSAWGLQNFVEQKHFQEKQQQQQQQQQQEFHKYDEKMRVEGIEPGLVIIRNFLSERECKRVAKHAFQLDKQGEDGFYTKDEQGNLVLNTGENCGRIYDTATRFLNGVMDYCIKAVKAARNVDLEMPRMQCTHVLLNMYTTSEGLVWHRDI